MHVTLVPLSSVNVTICVFHYSFAICIKVQKITMSWLHFTHRSNPSLRFMFKGTNFYFFLPFYILKRNEGFCLQIEFSLVKEAQTTLWRILYNSKFNFKKIHSMSFNNAWALNNERFDLLVFLVIQKPSFSNTQFEFITVNNQPTPYYPYDN